LIEVKNLVKRYGLIPAVDAISFTLEPGKVYGFLGPNGAGKSTTMNMMTGYIAPTEGEIWIDEYNIVEDSEEAKSIIGYLPEIPPVYPDMTVDEYLRFAAELKGIKRAERKKEVDRVVSRTRLTEYRRRLIRNLSKGYRQRVGLAQALLGDPKFIILDEPTVGLDPKQIQEIRSLIRELVITQEDVPKEDQPIVLLSSHIMQEVSAVCDEILIIVHGRIVVVDTPENLIERFHTNEIYDIEARCTEARLEEVLAPFKEMATFAFDSIDMPDGISKLRLTFAKGADVAEVMFKTLADSGIAVREMKNVIPTLEEIFLLLVSQADEEFAAREEARMREELGVAAADNTQKESVENVLLSEKGSDERTDAESDAQPETEEKGGDAV